MDAIQGKAKSKLLRRVYERLTGSPLASEADADEKHWTALCSGSTRRVYLFRRILMHSQMTELESAVVGFVKSQRQGIKRTQVILEIMQLHRLGADWPDATHEQWDKAIASAVASKSIEQRGEKLFPMVYRPRKEQLDLF